jgi:hypothetical protein
MRCGTKESSGQRAQIVHRAVAVKKSMIGTRQIHRANLQVHLQYERPGRFLFSPSTLFPPGLCHFRRYRFPLAVSAFPVTSPDWLMAFPELLLPPSKVPRFCISPLLYKKHGSCRRRFPNNRLPGCFFPLRVHAHLPIFSLFSTVDAISHAQVPSRQGTQIQHIAIAV